MNLKPAEAANLLGVSVKTLQRWDRTGVLKAYRTPTDRRYYTQEQIDRYLKHGADNSIDSDGIIDRGYKLVYQNDLNRPVSHKRHFISIQVKIKKGNERLVLIEDHNHISNLDDALDDLITIHSLEFDMYGLEISDTVIYNALLDFAINMYENGNEDISDEIYKIINNKQKLQQVVKSYLIQILSDE